MKFRKKPVVVEATQWFKNGDHPDVKDWLWEPGATACRECGKEMHVHGWIDTLEGGHNVCPSDWIITGVKGERYPRKSEIFHMTYEPAEES